MATVKSHKKRERETSQLRINIDKSIGYDNSILALLLSVNDIPKNAHIRRRH
jgi:hypothetical protein